MTAQEYYDKLIESVNCGVMPSVGNNYVCVYRGVGGTRCAVGILIPDEDYTPNLENTTADDLPSALLKKILPEGFTSGDLCQVQGAHDDTADKPNFPQQFIAGINKLSCFSTCKKVEA